MNIQQLRKKQILEKDYKKIENLNITEKYILVDFYSSRKINLCYEKLKKPKIVYNICYIENDNKYIIEISKTLYNDLNVFENLNILKSEFKPSENEIIQFERFKKYIGNFPNFFTENEKRNIIKVDLYFKDEYKKILELY